MATEWKKVKLGEICKITAGGDKPKNFSEKKTNKFSIPIFSNGIDNEGLYGYTDKATVPGKAITITGRGANVGTVFFRQEEFLPIIRLLSLIPDKKIIDSKYLFYLLKKHTFLSNGAAQPQITVPMISEHEILFNTSLETQQKIAGILSAYDDLIENNRKQIKLLEEAAQKLYKEWFVKLNFPGHENVKIVDGVPKGWKKVELNTVLSKVTTGLNPRKNFVLGKGNNYYVTIKNMGDNNLYLDDKCDKVDDEALEKINKRSDLQTGDILFSGIGTIGRVYLVSISTDNWDVSESVFTLRANEFISKEFLYLLLLSDDMQAYCDLNAHGAAQRGIRMADLKAYKFALPNSNLITRFTKIIAPYISKAQCLKNQNVSLQTARDKLLPKLMNNELKTIIKYNYKN